MTLEELRAAAVAFYGRFGTCQECGMPENVMLAMIDVAEAASRCSVWMKELELASSDEEALLVSVRTLTAALAAQEKT